MATQNLQIPLISETTSTETAKSSSEQPDPKNLDDINNLNQPGLSIARTESEPIPQASGSQSKIVREIKLPGLKPTGDHIEDGDATDHKGGSLYLYALLTCNVLIGIGAAYCFDFPQALEDQLIRRFETTTFEIGLLYSLYALPNLILAPVSGYVIEKYSMPISGLIFGFLTFTGQLMCLIAVNVGKVNIAVAGRGVYGIGAEGVYILQATVNEYWFSGSLLSVSNAICQIAINIGDMMGNYFTPYIFENSRSIPSPIFAGAGMCLISSIATLWYYFLHRYYEKRHQDRLEDLEMSPGEKELAANFALMHELLDYKIEFGFSSIQYFNLTFWLLCAVYLCLANALVQFTNIATEIVTNRFGYTYNDAKYFTILPQATFVVVSPFLSMLIERKGHKALALLGASIICFLVYISMYYTSADRPVILYLFMVMLGFCNSILLSTIFTSIALTVPKKGVSMAYSIMALVENLGIGLLPIYFGWLCRDRTIDDYNNAFISLMVLSGLSVVTSLILFFHDMRQNKLLDFPENSKKVKTLRSSINAQFLKKSFANSRKASRRGSMRASMIAEGDNDDKGEPEFLLREHHFGKANSDHKSSVKESVKNPDT